MPIRSSRFSSSFLYARVSYSFSEGFAYCSRSLTYFFVQLRTKFWKLTSHFRCTCYLLNKSKIFYQKILIPLYPYMKGLEFLFFIFICFRAFNYFFRMEKFFQEETKKNQDLLHRIEASQQSILSKMEDIENKITNTNQSQREQLEEVAQSLSGTVKDVSDKIEEISLEIQDTKDQVKKVNNLLSYADIFFPATEGSMKKESS